jgi:predicted HicB family RNase H-like nuclease
MPKQPKPKKPGRPRLAKSEAKSRVVVVRLTVEDHKRAATAAKGLKQTVSQWMRDMVNTSLQT